MKTLIKKWAKDLNRHLSEEDPQMISKHMKLCSTFFVTMEMKIKTAMRYQLEWMKFKTQTTLNAREALGH